MSLYVAVTGPNSSVVVEDINQMQKEIRFQAAYVDLVNNTGADIGIFIQQHQLVESRGETYDILFKMHTKSNITWRAQMMNSLCTGAERIEYVLSLFENYDNVGMVGPGNLTWTFSTPSNESYLGLSRFGFDRGIEEGMKKTWQVLYPGEDSFPDKREYRICAGSYYWARYKPLVSEFRPTTMLDLLPTGYPKPCRSEACGYMYSLERLIPTSMKAKQGLEVIDVDKFRASDAYRSAVASDVLDDFWVELGGRYKFGASAANQSAAASDVLDDHSYDDARFS